VRSVQTRPPSFPKVPTETPLAVEPGKVWQVLCGDTGHWRVGMYSPAASSAAELPELERHDCPELFLLIEGQLTLIVAEGDKTREIVLEQGVPVLIEAPHSGFCPGGPHSGLAFVVERDSFDTFYKTASDWTSKG